MHIRIRSNVMSTIFQRYLANGTERTSIIPNLWQRTKLSPVATVHFPPQVPYTQKGTSFNQSDFCLPHDHIRLQLRGNRMFSCLSILLFSNCFGTKESNTICASYRAWHKRIKQRFSNFAASKQIKRIRQSDLICYNQIKQ